MIDYNLVLAITMIFFSLIALCINKHNILRVFIFIELIIVNICLCFLIISFLNNTITGKAITLYVIIIAAAESSIALSILVCFYRIRGNIGINLLNLLKG